MISSLPLLLSIVLLLATQTAAHTFLLKPSTYNREYHTRFCKEPECSSACPIEKNRYRRRVRAVWARNQTVTIRWARNNHARGFIRFSLVPLVAQYSRFWHARFAIHHGCWESGPVKCRIGSMLSCGTDRTGVCFQRRVVVPNVFPDGVYVLGMTWYGGIRDGVNGFQDFYSCSYVRIEGGGKVDEGKFYAPFVAGTPYPKGMGVRNGLCLATADRTDVCGWAGCKNVRDKYGLPATVDRPMSERAFVTADEVRRVAEVGSVAGEAEGTEKAVCKGRVCCDGRCGVCGGDGCEKRVGGRKGCCLLDIVKSGRVCGKGFRAPCVLKV